MLLRVRCNLGTWKWNVDASMKISEVAQLISQEKSVRISQPLSLDPAGKQTVDLARSLQSSGMTKHGDMVFCRVETIDRGENNHSSSQNLKASSPKKKNPPVISLLDSEDEDDDEPVVVDPPPASRKRSRSSEGASAIRSSKQAAQQSPQNNLPSTFQIVSYNVWFGPREDPSARQVHPQERMKEICKEIKTCKDNLLFVGFQELTTNLRDYLAPHLNSMGFRLCTQPLGRNGYPYGVGLAISKKYQKAESKFVRFANSMQGRGILYVQTETMLFVTTHLESSDHRTTYNGVSQRQGQIKLAANFCQERLQQYPNLKIAMIAGDFNWDDERKQSTPPNQPLLHLVPPGWKDSGKPFDYTYDGKVNPMLGGNNRRRLDRCIYYDNASLLTAARLHKLGLSAIPNLTWNKLNTYTKTRKTVPVAPSDHFGIAVTFESK